MRPACRHLRVRSARLDSIRMDRARRRAWRAHRSTFPTRTALCRVSCARRKLHRIEPIASPRRASATTSTARTESAIRVRLVPVVTAVCAPCEIRATTLPLLESRVRRARVSTVWCAPEDWPTSHQDTGLISCKTMSLAQSCIVRRCVRPTSVPALRCSSSMTQPRRKASSSAHLPASTRHRT